MMSIVMNNQAGNVGIGLGQAIQGITAAGTTAICNFEQYQNSVNRTQPREFMDGYTFNVRLIDNGIIVSFAPYSGAKVKEVFCANATEVSEQIVRLMVEQKMEK